MALDIIDKRILELLQDDGSLSIADLAEKLGMTSPPCWRRVRRLRDEGYLQRQIWLLNPAKLDLDVIIFATVKLVTHDVTATSRFRECVSALPEVVECYILLGGVDALLKIRVKNIKDYEAVFYERLSQLPAVREVVSSVVLSEVKYTTSLPLSRE